MKKKNRDMHFLELKYIGKIYTKKRNVDVGIREVNLNFDLGEFVVITGRSGSGKTSLLNVIGGVDSYEEGEMLINGDSTSHFIDEEWEEYRKKYISFIFQEFNIIDSFTVFENVELALFHIDDLKERKRKALELIDRVGLSDKVHCKGSHLSGGQKQRTAIARALAKDSPIILADEPTGNLDSKTAKEIVNLLKEISKGKLLIMVTHNIEQVRDDATREIVVSDGKVVSDNKKESVYESFETNESISYSGKKNQSLLLGFKIFKSKPKLSLFLCFVLTLASVGMFLFTGVIGKEIRYNYIYDNSIVRDANGRVVLVKKDGTAIYNKDVEELAKKYGADDFLHCDILYDSISGHGWERFMSEPESFVNTGEQMPFFIDKVSDVGSLNIGDYPKTASECVLYIPFALSDYFGTDSLKVTKINQNGLEYDVVGIKYYCDNNQMGKLFLTEDGYKINSAVAYFGNTLQGEMIVEKTDDIVVKSNVKMPVTYSFEVKPDSVYIKNTDMSKESISSVEVDFYKVGSAEKYSDMDSMDAKFVFKVCDDKVCYDDAISNKNMDIVVNPYIFLERFEEYIDQNYAQCSLFFNNKKDKENAIKEINKTNYLAIDADTEYLSDNEVFSNYILSISIMVIIWVALLIFMLLFVSLCTKKIIEAFSVDVNIMRCVGVDINTIKCAVFLRMYFAMLPAIVLTLVIAFAVYRTAWGNSMVMYLNALNYATIFLGLFFIVFMVTRKQIKMLFSETVKNAMKGEGQ